MKARPRQPCKFSAQWSQQGKRKKMVQWILLFLTRMRSPWKGPTWGSSLALQNVLMPDLLLWPDATEEPRGLFGLSSVSVDEGSRDSAWSAWLCNTFFTPTWQGGDSLLADAFSSAIEEAEPRQGTDSFLLGKQSPKCTGRQPDLS